jgi:hypothetical protein
MNVLSHRPDLINTPSASWCTFSVTFTCTHAGAFELPELGQVMYKRVVVVTCLMAAKVWLVYCNVAQRWLQVYSRCRLLHTCLQASLHTDLPFCMRVLSQVQFASCCQTDMWPPCVMSAAQLHALGVPAGHFTHVFVDEAGHAEEPLTLAATAGLLTPGNRCVHPWHTVYWSDGAIGEAMPEACGSGLVMRS